MKSHFNPTNVIKLFLFTKIFINFLILITYHFNTINILFMFININEPLQGGGGLAIYGTGTMYCWASRVAEVVVRMMDGRKIDKRAFMDDSAYRLVVFVFTLRKFYFSSDSFQTHACSIYKY